MMGGLIPKCMTPNLEISITWYGKTALILEEFGLCGTFQEPINQANS